MQPSTGSRKRKALFKLHNEPISSRRRRPELRQLPQWLWAPLQGLVRSRPPMALEWDKKGRPVRDWDAWACRHLTQDYWGTNVHMQETWPSCVQQLAASGQQEDFSLVATSRALVSAIVTVTIAETIAHQHNTCFEELDLNVRRHINTTANRQCEDSTTKVTLYHVVNLALAWFDHQIFLNRLSCVHLRNEQQRKIQSAFDSMHATAKSSGTISDLRTAVVTLTQTLRAPLSDLIFMSWREPLCVSLSCDILQELAARAFVNCIPVHDIASICPYKLELCVQIDKLSSPAHDGRWRELVTFFHHSYKMAPVHHRHKLRAEFAFTVMTMLHAGLEHTFCTQQNIAVLAEEHTRRRSPSRGPKTFRDLLDYRIDCLSSQLR